MTVVPVSEMDAQAVTAECRETYDRLIARVRRRYNEGPDEIPCTPSQYLTHTYLIAKIINVVENAQLSLDRLRVYERFIFQQKTEKHVEDLVDAFDAVRRVEPGEVFFALSEAHVARATRFRTVIETSDREIFADSKTLPNPSSHTVIQFAVIIGDEQVGDYIIANLQAIGAFVMERRITEARKLIEYVKAMGSGSSPLMDGTL